MSSRTHSSLGAPPNVYGELSFGTDLSPPRASMPSLPHRITDWPDPHPWLTDLIDWLACQYELDEVVRLLDRNTHDLWVIRQAQMIAAYVARVDRDLVERLLEFPRTARPLAGRSDLSPESIDLVARSAVRRIYQDAGDYMTGLTIGSRVRGSDFEKALDVLAALEESGYVVSRDVIDDLADVAHGRRKPEIGSLGYQATGATKALEALPSSLDAETLLSLHNDEQPPRLRRWAATVLLTAGGRSPVSVVRKVFQQRAEEDPRHALTVIQDAGGFAEATALSREDLIPLLQAQNGSVRQTALLMLGEVRESEEGMSPRNHHRACEAGSTEGVGKSL